jgi:NAD(P)H-hydrate repair Nnr-like enzyme with NAD(P)H-hydrate epimerase domain
MTAARVRALAIVAVLVIAAVVLTIVTVDGDKQTHASYLSNCPAKAIPVVVKPLPERNEITIKVWNAGASAGDATSVAEDLRHRGYSVEKVGPKDNKPAISGVADIYYGPNTVAAAQVVRAEFLMTTTDQNQNMKFNIKSKSKVVDVLIGKSFRQLGATTEVNQAIAALGSPTAPTGTCPKTG